jgi:DHA1 family multidrug resistance protein-like MFS transporter
MLRTLSHTTPPPGAVQCYGIKCYNAPAMLRRLIWLPVQVWRGRLAPWERTFWAVWVARLLASLGFSFAFPLLPLYIQYLGVRDSAEAAAWAGALSAGSALSMGLAAPLWGTLADRHGRKLMLQRALFSGAVLITLMGLAPNVQVLFGLRVVQGLFTGVVTAATVLVTSQVPRDRLASSLGLLSVGTFIGTSAGPFVGGLIADTLGFRTSFFLTGVMLLLGGLIVTFGVREQFTPPAHAQESARGPGGVLRATLSSLALLREGGLASVIAVTFLVHLGTMVVSPVLPLYIQQLSGSEQFVASTAGGIAAGTAMVSALSAVFVGRLADRVGHRRILVVCTLLAGLLYLPQGLARSPLELLVLRAAMALFLGGVLPTANALIAVLAPEHRRGAFYGLMQTVSSLGSVIGPVAGATVAATFGLHAVFFVTGSILIAVGGWAALAIRPVQQEAVGEGQAAPVVALAEQGGGATRPTALEQGRRHAGRG